MKIDPNKKYVLVKYADNWADETDIDGFEVMEKAEYEGDMDRLSKMPKDFWVLPPDPDGRYGREEERSVCIGTNEFVYFGSFKNVERAFKAKDIPIADLEVLNRYFQKYNFMDSGIVGGFMKVYHSIVEDMAFWYDDKPEDQKPEWAKEV